MPGPVSQHKIMCQVCRRAGYPNILGTLRDDVYSITFPPDRVCRKCSEALAGLVSELVEQYRARGGMPVSERIERLVYRLRNGGRTPPVKAMQAGPSEVVDALLRELGISTGEDHDG